MNPFTQHTQQQGVTYLEHLFFAAGIAWRLSNSVFAFTIHALFPFISIDSTVDLEATANYLQAMELANDEAEKKIGENMLIAWYDRDRDFESPQHASECHANSAIPGYIDYALYHGATLKIDIENGRFIFFYLPIDF